MKKILFILLFPFCLYSQTYLPAIAQKYMVTMKANSYTPKGVDVQSLQHQVINMNYVATDGGYATSGKYTNLVQWYPVVGNNLSIQTFNIINALASAITFTNTPTANVGYTAFNGTTQAGILTATSAMVPVALTYCCWVKTTSLSQALQGVFGYDAGNGTTRFAVILINSSGNLGCYVGNGSGNTVTQSPTITLSTNTWYHVAMTWSNASQTISAYVNGVLDGTGTATSLTLTQSGGRINFAKDDNATLRFLTGSATDYMIFNTVLTAPQILAIYNGEKFAKGF